MLESVIDVGMIYPKTTQGLEMLYPNVDDWILIKACSGDRNKTKDTIEWFV